MSRDRPALLYGRNAVREALRGRRRVARVWGLERELDALRASGLPSDVRLAAAARDELAELCGSDDHQGLVADAGPYPYADPRALLEPADALILALDQVQDPRNLGAVCRTAECAGATGVVITARRAAAVTPAVCRTSAGAVEHLPIARAGNLASFIGEAKRAGAWVYGAQAGAATPYTDPDYSGRVVLVLGGEGSGLRPRVRSECDALVSLPIAGRVGSLNVAAAAAALVYEVVRQR